jgi:hypothetical protein
MAATSQLGKKCPELPSTTTYDELNIFVSV